MGLAKMIKVEEQVPKEASSFIVTIQTLKVLNVEYSCLQFKRVSREKLSCYIISHNATAQYHKRAQGFLIIYFPSRTSN